MSMGIVMTAIILLAFASMAASIFITETTQGLATAINESGALRMRSYRIATNLTPSTTDNQLHWKETFQLIEEFETHLYSTNLTNIIPADQSSHLNLAYHKIIQQWQMDIRPLFDIYLDGIIGILPDTAQGLDMSISEDAVKNLRNRYVLVVSDFVSNIDALVSLLEENTETRIKGLHRFQLVAIILTIFLTLTALILIYSRIQKPLKQLLTAAERASQSDFTYRTDYTGKDELGKLGTAFNTMAEDLSKIYQELEQRIAQKTLDLEQSNRSLQLLYKTVNLLNEAESPHTTYATILNDIEQISTIGRGAICLNDNKIETATMLASTLKETDISHQLCTKSNCKTCLNDGHSNIKQLTDSNQNSKQIVTIPISDQTTQYGVLIIEPASANPVEDWQLQLLESIARHIGIAIKLSQQSDESRRLVLIEERGAIARELHDSLAQSLTFMKIQLSRLQAITSQSSSESASEESVIIAELKMGLNSAYRELRELLTTFRLKIDGKDFNEALIKTILEFNDRSDTEIKFENQITYCDLTPNEEIHILQLVREALSNIVQHAQASSALVVLKYNQADDIQVTITDNGTGIISDENKTHHYGLNIMKERAKTLHGSLAINNNPDRGTTITLIFTPKNKTVPIKLSNNQ